MVAEWLIAKWQGQISCRVAGKVVAEPAAGKRYQRELPRHLEHKKGMHSIHPLKH